MADLPLFDPFAALAKARSEASNTSQELSQELSQPPAKEISHTEQLDSPDFATFADPIERAETFAHARVKEEEGNSSFFSDTYAREVEALPGSSEGEPIDPAKVAKAARVSLSHSDITQNPEMAVAKVSEDSLRKWREGLEGLSPDSIPCPGYRPDEWARTLARALDFLDTFGPQAEALGWTAPRLFGVHPLAGISRVDACGALTLPGSGRVRAITAAEIRFERGTYREKPGQPEGVPIWSFRR